MHHGRQSLSDNHRLITQLRSGDKSVFEEIFRIYCQPLTAFAIQELKGESLADDAVQEVFCKLWLYRKKLDATQSLRGFLFTCLRNHILNTIRTRKHEIIKHYRFANHQPRGVSNPEQEAECHEIEGEMHQFVNRLPSLKRKIVKLSLYQGLSHEQIAQKLDISVVTVKIYCSQTSRQLRELIEVHGAKLLIFSLFHSL